MGAEFLSVKFRGSFSHGKKLFPAAVFGRLTHDDIGRISRTSDVDRVFFTIIITDWHPWTRNREYTKFPQKFVPVFIPALVLPILIFHCLANAINSLLHINSMP
jgi:hypothetical protein